MPARCAYPAAHDLNSEFKRQRHRQDSCLVEPPCLSFHQLHHEEVDAILSASIVQRADVWMVQVATTRAFSLEAFARVGIVGDT